jgi:hypothetical protein
MRFNTQGPQVPGGVAHSHRALSLSKGHHRQLNDLHRWTFFVYWSYPHSTIPDAFNEMSTIYIFNCGDENHHPAFDNRNPYSLTIAALRQAQFGSAT